MDIKYTEKDDFGYYVIYEKQILGWMYSEIHNNYEIVYGFFIEEKYRNKHIGSELLSRYLKLKLDKDIYLHVQINNLYAIKLYSNFGFSITNDDIITNKYKPKYKDVYFMKLNKS